MKRPKIRQHYTPFFYPLDALRDWNRLYGSPGMLQYQCVVPPQNQRQAIAALLDAAALSPEVPCLVVLKTFGSLPSPGLLSFARPGATLTLDFPFRGEATLKLLSQLDSITAEAGGALYPAKDGRMPRDMFRSSFPRWEQLVIDPAMSSNFWRRVAQ
jgi:L-gulonolactone oxidase